MNITFDPAQPWVGVMTFAARDHEYWAKNVVRPAQTFIARGGSGRRMTKDLAEGVLMDKEVAKLTAPPEPGQGQSRNARKRRAAKDRNEEAKKWGSPGKGSWNEGTSSSWSSKGGKSQKGAVVHPRKFGNTFITTREGDEICYKFAKGAPGACGEPCPEGRVHCCQYCLGQHPNVNCQKKDNRGGKGSGGGGVKPPGK